MDILNEQGEVIENPDLSLGYLIDDILEIEHPAIPEIKEVSHMETIWEDPKNPNNRIIKKVIDVPYRQEIPAWVEKKKIKRYVLYTTEELAEMQAQKEKEEQERLEQEKLMREEEERRKKEAEERAKIEAEILALPARVDQHQEDLDEVFIVIAELAAM